MITKQHRVEAIRINKQTILDFLSNNWERLTTDQAISENFDYENGDTRRIVMNFIQQEAVETKFH